RSLQRARVPDRAQGKGSFGVGRQNGVGILGVVVTGEMQADAIAGLVRGQEIVQCFGRCLRALDLKDLILGAEPGGLRGRAGGNTGYNELTVLRVSVEPEEASGRVLSSNFELQPGVSEVSGVVHVLSSGSVLQDFGQRRSRGALAFGAKLGVGKP